jgi:hypothetical protein
MNPANKRQSKMYVDNRSNQVAIDSFISEIPKKKMESVFLVN